MGRFTSIDQKPVLRAYIHQAGFVECYSGSFNHAWDHLMNVLNAPPEGLGSMDLAFACVWGQVSTGDRIVDLLGYSDVDPWPGNPGFSGWVMINGVYSPQDEITCEDTIIALGKEAEYRRRTKNLTQYQTYPPSIPSIRDIE